MHHFPGLFPNPSWATRSLKTAPFGTVQTFLVHTVTNKQTRQWHHIGWHWLHKHQTRFRSVSQQNGCFLAYFTQNRSSYSRAGASFWIHNSSKKHLWLLFWSSNMIRLKFFGRVHTWVVCWVSWECPSCQKRIEEFPNLVAYLEALSPFQIA